MYVATPLRNSGVMILNRDLHRLLAGQSIELKVDDAPVGRAKIAVDHPFCWGWLPALKAPDAKAGKVLQIQVDLAAKSAEVLLGGEELWT